MCNLKLSIKRQDKCAVLICYVALETKVLMIRISTKHMKPVSVSGLLYVVSPQ